MTTTKSKISLSSGERKRQLEESVTRAMDVYKSDFEAVRDRTAKLRAAREASEASEAAQQASIAPLKAAAPRKRKPAAK